ncbi:cysteine desulfurase [Patescibacteria group bacterium]|nr:cysteine desulfurase [Patescibacteria group bacterium]
MQKIVYADCAGATQTDERVIKEMNKGFTDGLYANPSSFHSAGKLAKDALDDARISIAHDIGANADEIIFTSGGTESYNLAILGYARKYKEKGNHIITTSVEHKAVLMAMRQLEREGFVVTYLPVDEFGLVSELDIVSAIKPETILVSIIYANNEIGSINSISRISKIIKSHKNFHPYLVFHTDACQAGEYLDLDVASLGVDLMTLNSGKMYGPKGVGLLYKKRGIKLEPLQYGGYQENGLRPGTENVIGILGFAKALEIATAKKQVESSRLIEIRDYFISEVKNRIPKVRLNGHQTQRLPNNANISFMNVEGEAMLLHLDAKGIYASTGSACTSKSLDPSHVILATGVPYEVAHGSIRFTFGRHTTKKDVDYILECLPDIVAKLRRISSINVDARYYE